MEQLQLILSVALMFFLRIGIPVLVLIVLGALIERWQNRRDDYIRQYYAEQSTGRQYQQQEQQPQSDEHDKDSDGGQIGEQHPIRQT